MTPKTKHEALEKLAALSTGVGYPARWRDYSALVVKPDDLLGNWQRALKFEAQYRLGNVAGSAGGEWVLPPQTVNAYYSAAANEMVIPAAILQPPLFDVRASPRPCARRSPTCAPTMRSTTAARARSSATRSATRSTTAAVISTAPAL